MIAAYTVHFRRHVLLGFQTPFSKSPDIRAFAHGFNGPFNAHSPLTLGESFGASLKTLVLLLASDRIKSPSDVIQRLAWTSTDKPEFAAAELIILFYLLNAYPMLRKAFPPTDPLARSLMFLLYATGSPLLPAGKIDMSFIEKFPGPSVDSSQMDPENNPAHWPDV
ncbi:hypothetical protein C8F04DRAFT_1152835, partial [Mycena alexandri]